MKPKQFTAAHKTFVFILISTFCVWLFQASAMWLCSFFLLNLWLWFVPLCLYVIPNETRMQHQRNCKSMSSERKFCLQNARENMDQRQKGRRIVGRNYVRTSLMNQANSSFFSLKHKQFSSCNSNFEWINFIEDAIGSCGIILSE